jgi:glutathione reductase (NADPH)
VTDPDLFVIGGGSGGIRAARVAAALGARVVLAESGHLGGTCVNVGCVPKKLLVNASRFRQSFVDAAGFGFSGADRAGFDWSALIRNKDAAILRINGAYERLLEEAGVELVRGRARLLDATTVAVGDQRFTPRYILVATGGRPVLPQIPGGEHVITSDEAFFLGTLPRRALVVGGGYIAVEFACIFHGLGVDTALVHRGTQLLRGFDDEIRTFLGKSMADSGVTLHLDNTVHAIHRDADGLHVQLNDGTRLDVDLILCAIGRNPNTAGLGLEQVDVALNENGAIRVDAGFRSSVPSIFALGDVIDRVQLTPVAIAEAKVLVQNLFGGGGAHMDYHDVPTAVFSTPELASVGLSEEAARMACADIRTYRAAFTPTREMLTGSGNRTLVKLVVDGASDRVLGAHMVGEGAAEIIQGLAIAIKAGTTKAQFDATVGLHPTAAEEFVTLR